MLEKSQKVIVVAGPTSSGKSDFAVELAHNCNGEIISADSRQIYKGLDIGTGKITKKEMRGIPHHMLDVLSPGEPFSVSEYKRMASPILEDILARGKTPIICGGTGQYIDALIYNQTLPKVPPNARLREELSYLATEELSKKLRMLDEERWSTIDKHNRVRLIRAIEIASSFGKVPKLTTPKLFYRTTMYLLSPTRELMHERITKRLLKRFDEGMVEEVKQLINKGMTHDECERLGLEYRYISRYLRALISYEEMVRLLTFKTNQYGKRQCTWLKKYEQDKNLELKIIEIKK